MLRASFCRSARLPLAAAAAARFPDNGIRPGHRAQGSMQLPGHFIGACDAPLKEVKDVYAQLMSEGLCEGGVEAGCFFPWHAESSMASVWSTGVATLMDSSNLHQPTIRV